MKHTPTTEPTTSQVASHNTRSRYGRRRRITKDKICPTCVWYSEEFTRFFKDATQTITIDKKRYKVYKQNNHLKTGKHSLEEFEETKEGFVRHFNDCHVSNNYQLID